MFIINNKPRNRQNSVGKMHLGISRLGNFFNQSTYLFHKKKHMSPLNFEEILFISCFYLIDAIKIRQRFILFILGTLIKTPLQSKIRFIIYIRLCSTNNIKWFPNHRVYNKNKSIYWTCYFAIRFDKNIDSQRVNHPLYLL